jgi:hypothetical protein
VGCQGKKVEFISRENQLWVEAINSEKRELGREKLFDWIIVSLHPEE